MQQISIHGLAHHPMIALLGSLTNYVSRNHGITEHTIIISEVETCSGKKRNLRTPGTDTPALRIVGPPVRTSSN
jgi:hypothetical protein